jgi:hypothetical protein
MKYVIKQKKRQAASMRVMRREKREIQLMHERAVMRNFNNIEKNKAMYDRIMADDFDKDKLNNDEKKTYSLCKKFWMLNEYQNLMDLESEIQKLRYMMETETNGYEYSRLRKKLKDRNDEYREYKKKLTDNDEDRRNFNLCVALSRMEY